MKKLKAFTATPIRASIVITASTHASVRHHIWQQAHKDRDQGCAESSVLLRGLTVVKLGP